MWQLRALSVRQHWCVLLVACGTCQCTGPFRIPRSFSFAFPPTNNAKCTLIAVDQQTRRAGRQARVHLHQNNAESSGGNDQKELLMWPARCRFACTFSRFGPELFFAHSQTQKQGEFAAAFVHLWWGLVQRGTPLPARHSTASPIKAISYRAGTFCSVEEQKIKEGTNG